MAMQAEVQSSVSWAFKMYKQTNKQYLGVERINDNHFNMPTRITQRKLRVHAV